MTKHFGSCVLATALVSLAVSPIARAEKVPEVDFGNDSGQWAGDGECDDARFLGEGMAGALVTDNIGRDATDCRSAMGENRVRLNPLFAVPTEDDPIDYGDDRSRFAGDGVCDDIRFTGDYSANTVYIVDDIGHDASDCRAAVDSGKARWQGNDVAPATGITVEDIVEEMNSTTT